MTLPTPRQERLAIVGFIAFAAFCIVGAATVLGAIGLALVWIARWVFGQ